MGALIRDLRLSLRRLRSQPGFTAVAVLTLAVGIGANVAIFSVVYGALLRPLSYPHPEQLISLHESIPQFAQQYPEVPVNARSYVVWRDHSRLIARLPGGAAAIALIEPDTRDLTGAGEPRQIVEDDVSSTLLATLGVKPRLGRDFTAAQDLPGKNHVVILTDACWRNLFGADPHILGRTVNLDGKPLQIIGVLPAGFRFPKGLEFGPLIAGSASGAVEMFRPIGLDLVHAEVGDWNYGAFARLKPGVSPARARAAFNGLVKADLVATKAPFRQVDVLVRSLRDQWVGENSRGLWLLLAAVGAILLIVCLNLANVQLVRIHGRGHELALRLALGAGRGRLLREVLTEGILLAFLGGGVGALAAWAGVRGLVHAAPAGIPRLDQIGVNAPVLGFALLLACASGVLFSLWPALRAARTDPQDALRGGGRGGGDTRSRLHARAWMVAAQSALAALLLITAGLLTASYLRLMSVPLGFQPAQATTVRTEWDAGGMQRAAYYHAALTNLAALPGVRAVGLTNRLPLEASGDTGLLAMPHDPRPFAERPLAERRAVSPGYFAAMGIPLLRGRTFSAADVAAALPRKSPYVPVVISQQTAKALWPGRDPIGRQVGWTGDSGRPLDTVVGVVGDVRSRGLNLPPALTLYEPYTLALPPEVVMVVRGSGLATLAPAIRRALWSAQPAATIPEIKPLGAVVSGSAASRQFQMWLVLLFALCALLLAVLGIYGVVAYAVARRTTELGVRLALGADGGRIFVMILRQGLTPVVAGLIAGVAAALVSGRLLASLLFGVRASDPAVIAAVCALLLLMAAAACAIPARQAARTSPLAALRG
ncbi:MAG: ABC transporter permease [Terriglobales bacterium]